MEVLSTQSWENGRAMMMEEEEDEEEGQKSGDREEEAAEAPCTGTDEESDEDEEAEPPLVIRRKVSFADAFGLNLVSVKEFDNAEAEDASLTPEGETAPSLEEYTISCLFTLPSSPEELDWRVDTQKVELESLELLPGTTTIRGIVRVANLCYTKSVYVRMSLDRWTSYFDLLAEYMPGSSDRKTDRFTFKYTLVPPIDRDGARVEMCLRYETPVGTFWANNSEMNFVLFCYKKVNTNERGSKAQKEGGSYMGKRSCLRPGRRASVEEKTRETGHTAVFAGAEAANKDEEADRKTISKAEAQSLANHKPSVDGIKSRRRQPRLAHAQEFFSQRSQRSPRTSPHDSASSQEVARPLPNLWGDSSNCINKKQSVQSKGGPKVLTYHEIPLLTLDWNNDKAHRWGTARTDDLWSGTKTTLPTASMDDIPSVIGAWDTFLKDKDNDAGKETSACDSWQSFLDKSGRAEHSGVPESEWLQTAASVSPSNDEKSTKNAADSQDLEFLVGTDAPATSHEVTTASCQRVSESRGALLATAALNPSDGHLMKACVSGPNEENAATQDGSQRSEMNSPAGNPEEFNVMGETAVCEDSVDSSAECQKLAMREHEVEEIREGVEGKDVEPFASPTADLVTSSGESETTGLTSVSEPQNGSAVDRISQGASLDEGLSYSGEGQVTGTAHNAADDTLAFRGTIRQGTKAEGLFVFSIPTQGAEKGDVNNSAESAGEEIFMPHKTQECEISQRFADEIQHDEVGPRQHSGNPLQENESDENETAPARSDADEFNLKKTCWDNFEQGKIEATEFKTENENAGSNNKTLELYRMVEAEPSHTTSGAQFGMIQGLNEGERQNDVSSSQPYSLHQRENISEMSGVDGKKLKQSHAVEGLQIQEDPEDSKLTQRQEGVGLKCEAGTRGLVSDQTEEEKILICDGKTEQEQDINPTAHLSHTGESQEAPRGEDDTFRPFSEDKCNPCPMAAAEMRWVHTRDNVKGRQEDIGHQIGPKEAAKGVIDTSGEPQCQPETLERTEEDKRQRGNNEKASVGELKIEAPGELMGNGGIAQREGGNVPTQFKEQEQTAGVKSCARVESEKLSAGTKGPIMAGGNVALEAMESRLEEMCVQRFGEDLIRAIWEEVFNLKGSHRDSSVVDKKAGELADTPDVTRDCHPPFEDSDDAFDSGVYSLTDLPSDPSPESTLVAQSGECLPKDWGRTLDQAEQTHSLSESELNLNSRAQFSQVIAPISPANSRQSSSESSQSSLSDPENHAQIKERSVTCQETAGQIKECVVTHKESCDRSDHPSCKHRSASSEKLRESGSLSWWSVFYILGHISRLLICSLLVAGFFFVVFLCDFPAFFALYMFSLCGWFYKLKGHQVAARKRIAG